MDDMLTSEQKEEMTRLQDKYENYMRQACDEITKLQARVRELEKGLIAERDRADGAERTLRDKNEQLNKWKDTLYARESELAPIRALKVGEVPWAMYQMAIGNTIVDIEGEQWSAKTSALCSYAPFTLHTEPPPLPTAEELAAAIEAWLKDDTEEHLDQLAAAEAECKRLRKDRICMRCGAKHAWIGPAKRKDKP